MAAGALDITIEQGATWNLVLTWKINGSAVNLTSYTGRMQVRVDVDDTETILSLTTDAGGGIVLGGALGTITLSRSATQTAALASGEFVYDLELQSAGGEVTRLVQGSFTVTAEVTR
jgi:hypothetical protein